MSIYFWLSNKKRKTMTRRQAQQMYDHYIAEFFYGTFNNFRNRMSPQEQREHEAKHTWSRGSRPRLRDDIAKLKKLREFVRGAPVHAKPLMRFPSPGACAVPPQDPKEIRRLDREMEDKLKGRWG